MDLERSFGFQQGNSGGDTDTSQIGQIKSAYRSTRINVFDRVFGWERRVNDESNGFDRVFRWEGRSFRMGATGSTEFSDGSIAVVKILSTNMV